MNLKIDYVADWRKAEQKKTTRDDRESERKRKKNNLMGSCVLCRGIPNMCVCAYTRKTAMYVYAIPNMRT